MDTRAVVAAIVPPAPWKSVPVMVLVVLVTAVQVVPLRVSGSWPLVLDVVVLMLVTDGAAT